MQPWSGNGGLHLERLLLIVTMTSGNNAKARILFVDDDDDDGILMICAEALRSLAGVEVAVERDSQQAAERRSHKTFDLLISDLSMPSL